MYQDLKDTYEELNRIFGGEATDKVYSLMSSLQQRIENLVKSRDKWKQKYIDCTFKKRKI